MGRRRSKWRKTWQIYKKMLQEARKVRAKQSLRQCPVCGTPYSLAIELDEDEQGVKYAIVTCSNCGFETKLTNLPAIADEFWVYAKVMDLVQSGALAQVAQPAEAKAETSEESVASEAEVSEAEVGEESESGVESEGLSEEVPSEEGFEES